MPFAINTIIGLNFAFPDVCLTPMPTPTPIPYPNFALTTTSIPTAFHVFTVCAPQLNMFAFAVAVSYTHLTLPTNREV